MSQSMLAARATRGSRASTPRAFVAVDWSGAITGVRRRMWLAEARRFGLARLECGRDRDALVRHLVLRATREPELVVGLDFAFSCPRWFLEHHRLRDAPELWDLVAREGEAWLAHSPRPFWGKPGSTRPPPDEARGSWRVTEGELARIRGIGPKSVFQIGGAGSVGTGSLRGMPCLATLRKLGFSIWPFDAPRLPMVVEIYPRYLTGPVNKSSRVARALYVQAHLPRESRALQDLAASSEDAFDAAVSAACMRRFARDFERLDERRCELDSIEGRIWTPTRDPTFERW